MGTCEKMDFTRPKQERDVTRQCLVVCLLFLTFLVFFINAAHMAGSTWTKLRVVGTTRVFSHKIKIIIYLSA